MHPKEKPDGIKKFTLQLPADIEQQLKATRDEFVRTTGMQVSLNQVALATLRRGFAQQQV